MQPENPRRPRHLRAALRTGQFIFFAALAAVAAYAAVQAGSSDLAPRTRLALAIVSAIIVGILTAFQVVLALESRRAPTALEPAFPNRRVPTQLPTDLNDFTARSIELDWLLERLTQRQSPAGAVAISAIAGQGGVGKTVLAIHAAHMVADHFPNGQIYVNLRGPEAQALAPMTVLGSLLRELGVAAEAIPENLDDRSRLFRSILGRMRILIVLDNAQNEAQVRPLLPGESTSVVLITSRSRLTGLEGVQVIRLDVMTSDESLSLLREIIGDSRTAAEEAQARELVKLCSHLPLAVRIVGARIAANPHWRLSDFVRRLRRERRLLSELTDGERAVRATLEISYVALQPSTKRDFCRLGALTIRSFPEWIFAEIAHGSGGDQEEQLGTSRDELVRTEMLNFAGIDELGVGRYSFHDLLREFSREKLADYSTDDETARSVVLAVAFSYTRILREADREIRNAAPRHNIHSSRTPGDLNSSGIPPVSIDSAAAGRAWIRSELPNLLLIISQLSTMQHHSLCVAMANLISAFCEESSYWREWETAQRSALASSESLEDRRSLRLAQFTLGRIHHLLGNWPDARTEFQRAGQMAAGDDDKEILAAVLCAQGKIDQLGRLELAIPKFEEARHLYSEIQNHHAEAYVTANIADIYHLRGEWARSLSEFDKCMPVFRQVGDRWWEANAGIWIGDVYRGQGNYDAAVGRLEASLSLMRELGDERRASVALVHLARTHADFDAGELSLTAVGEAMPALERAADRWWTAMAYVEMGKANALLNRNAEAIVCFRAALPTVQEMQNKKVTADIQSRIAAAESSG